MFFTLIFFITMNYLVLRCSILIKSLQARNKNRTREGVLTIIRNFSLQAKTVELFLILYGFFKSV